MGKPQAPPNLRYSTSDKDCSSCRAFKPKSQTCSMFSDWPVAPDLVCDDWVEKKDEHVKHDGETH